MIEEAARIQFEVDGNQVEVPDDGGTLLGALRDVVGNRSVKDGCSPQGQCGCCTVLVDGQARVACVTPTRRVKGRSITTIEGLDQSAQERWSGAFCATGASQCGFCTPGIIVRLAGLEAKKPNATDEDVHKALAAHLCRCTGWQTIVEAWHVRDDEHAERDWQAASRRAEIEGRTPQQVSPAVALGEGGFADDTAPPETAVAVRSATGDWISAPTLHAAREAVGKVQGRRTTLDPLHPIELPPGDFAATLQTTWVDPGYLETDAAWAMPEHPAATPLANGGAFGAKLDSPVAQVAEQLAADHEQPVRVLYSREDSVRLGAKRPPVAGGAAADGTGVLRIAATPGIEEAIARVAPDLTIEQIDIEGELTTAAAIRAAGWAEAVALLTLARGKNERVVGPEGGWAEATVTDDGINVQVSAGQALDATVLRSYCIGAAHMGFSWVTSEALTVDDQGIVQDLTVRSFGIVRASDTPPITIEIVDSDDEPVNASDAVFVAVAAATALARNAQQWPAGAGPVGSAQ